jgi:hypothetical protein
MAKALIFHVAFVFKLLENSFVLGKRGGRGSWFHILLLLA